MTVHNASNIPTYYQMLLFTRNDFAPLSENHCTQSKCKVILSHGFKYKTCEKCHFKNQLHMQRKQKLDSADEEPGPHSPAIASRNISSDLNQESNTEASHLS